MESVSSSSMGLSFPAFLCSVFHWAAACPNQDCNLRLAQQQLSSFVSYSVCQFQKTKLWDFEPFPPSAPKWNHSPLAPKLMVSMSNPKLVKLLFSLINWHKGWKQFLCRRSKTSTGPFWNYINFSRTNGSQFVVFLQSICIVLTCFGIFFQFNTFFFSPERIF